MFLTRSAPFLVLPLAQYDVNLIQNVEATTGKTIEDAAVDEKPVLELMTQVNPLDSRSLCFPKMHPCF